MKDYLIVVTADTLLHSSSDCTIIAAKIFYYNLIKIFVGFMSSIIQFKLSLKTLEKLAKSSWLSRLC
jgi:hypothetical protein